MKVTVKTKLTNFILGLGSTIGLEVRAPWFQCVLCWLVHSEPWTLVFLCDKQIKISKILLTLHIVWTGGKGEFFGGGFFHIQISSFITNIAHEQLRNIYLTLIQNKNCIQY